MKLKKNAKPLSLATVGELTDRKCGFCGLNLQFTKADPGEGLAWLSCPTYMAEREFSKNEHSSFSVQLKETGYMEGDEQKVQAELRDSRPKKKQHDAPKKTAQPAGAFGKR